MMKTKNHDFAGWASKNNVRCSDGVIIEHGAFADDDQKKVPLVWQHQRNNPDNILGYAILEHRDDGLYAYGYFNETKTAINTKALLEHGDIGSLSVYAPVVKRGDKVISGSVKELSLVLSGANPGALIEYISHGEGGVSDVIFQSGIAPEIPINERSASSNIIEQAEETVGDVLKTLTDEQLAAVAFILENATLEQSDLEGDEVNMKPNAFDKSTDNTNKAILEHSEISALFTEAVNTKAESLKTIMQRAIKEKGVIEHSITNIGKLFPDAQTLQNEPYILKDENTSADKIFNGVKKVPFSRIKTQIADMTDEDACRAKGYITGAEKLEQVFEILDRETGPQTIYKKQRIDRDDFIDITDFNIVNFMKREMVMFLKEEMARALLVGDGRQASNADKIKETAIRPIISDDDIYAIKVSVTGKHSDLIDGVIKARKMYKGSGNPTMYISYEDMADLLLLKDNMGRYLYDSPQALANKLRIKEFVETSFMPVGKFIMVNLSDYAIGSNKGGEMNWFDDFDINFNKMIYLIETRLAGALIKPKSAIVFTLTAAAQS